MKTDCFLFVGSYAKSTETGISVYSFDESSGESSLLNQISGIENPSYFNLSVDGRYLYAVSEVKEIEARVYAFAYDKNLKHLQMLNYQKTSGFSPCYIWIDENRTMVVTANYRGGNINVFPISKDGRLYPTSAVLTYKGHGINLVRQEKSHPHCIYSSPKGDNLFVDDLGTDRIYKYQIEKESSQLLSSPTGTIYLHQGEGPRHAVFHPNGRFVYLLCELSGNVVVLRYEGGSLVPVQYIGTGDLYAKGGGDIHVSPDGNFVYASYRLNSEGIAIFKVNETNGRLCLIGFTFTKSHPRNFAISPNGQYLLCACMNDDLIQAFKICNQSGLLTDSYLNIGINRPACLKFYSSI
jgi:6-phosphogluconolactonase